MKQSDIKWGEKHKVYAGTKDEQIVVAVDMNYRYMSPRVNVRTEAGKLFPISARSLSPMEPLPVKETEPNAGHCCHCLKVMKLKRGKMVLHGYTRPGHGWIEGSCSGVGTVPYETSPDELLIIRASVVSYQTRMEEYLGRLERNEVPSLIGKVLIRSGEEGYRRYYTDYRSVVVLREDTSKENSYDREPWFEKLRRAEMRTVELQIRAAQDHIVLIDEWHAKWVPGMPLLHKE